MEGKLKDTGPSFVFGVSPSALPLSHSLVCVDESSISLPPPITLRRDRWMGWTGLWYHTSGEKTASRRSKNDKQQCKTLLCSFLLPKKICCCRCSLKIHMWRIDKICVVKTCCRHDQIWRDSTLLHFSRIMPIMSVQGSENERRGLCLSPLMGSLPYTTRVFLVKSTPPS